MASVLQSQRPSAAQYKEPKQKKTMTTLETLTVIYLVMVVIAAFVVYDHISNPRCYRIAFSIIVGLLWPIPAALFLMLWVESAIVDIIDFFRN